MTDRPGAAARPPAPTGQAARAAGAWRVVLALPHLALGGAQRVAASMAAYWADGGHEVAVVTWRPEPDFFALPRRVARIRLPEPGGPLSRARRVVGLRSLYRGLLALQDAAVAHAASRRWLGRAPAAYLRLQRARCWRTRALRRVLCAVRPDAVVGLTYRANVIAVAASAGLPHRVVVSERTDPARRRRTGSWYGFREAPWYALREIAYPAADVVTANSHGALTVMRAYCPADTLRFVPNPLVLPPDPADRGRPDGGVRAGRVVRRDAVLFLGRLAPQKRLDVLIEAFARVVRAAPDWRLEMAGAGRLAPDLRRQTAALGLTDAVTFHGAVADPAPLLGACRIFALPSRDEGTPNALLEAMAHRMACVVSDASPGPLRLIEHGVTGLVVETGSVTGLADALAALVRDAAWRERLGAAAFERVREFGIDRVGPVWDRIVFPAERQP